MKKLVLAGMVAAFALTGCAFINETECNGDGAYWEWRGEYDSVQGDQPWIEAYARACQQRFGSAVDAERYLKGWEVGHATFNQRVDLGM